MKKIKIDRPPQIDKINKRRKFMNLQKLRSFASFQDDWNGYGAKAFSKNLISEVKYIISNLDIQPEIFPTACDSLQLEYDKDDGSHMEIEISENSKAEIFTIDENGIEDIIIIDATIKEINKAVNDFYG